MNVSLVEAHTWQQFRQKHPQRPDNPAAPHCIRCRTAACSSRKATALCRDPFQQPRPCVHSLPPWPGRRQNAARMQSGWLRNCTQERHSSNLFGDPHAAGSAEGQPSARQRVYDPAVIDPITMAFMVKNPAGRGPLLWTRKRRPYRDAARRSRFPPCESSNFIQPIPGTPTVTVPCPGPRGDRFFPDVSMICSRAGGAGQCPNLRCAAHEDIPHTPA